MPQNPLDVRSLAGILKMLRQDQAPTLNFDFKANCITRVCINGHFMGITSSFAVEIDFHNVTRCVGMSACVLNAIDPLCEDAALCHSVHRIDDRLYEVRPTRSPH
jgi:hypothetical protein